MQEINRGVAHLGSKTPRTVIRATNRSSVPACVVAGTIGLLCGSRLVPSTDQSCLPNRTGRSVSSHNRGSVKSPTLTFPWSRRESRSGGARLSPRRPVQRRPDKVDVGPRAQNLRTRGGLLASKPRRCPSVALLTFPTWMPRSATSARPPDKLARYRAADLSKLSVSNVQFIGRLEVSAINPLRRILPISDCVAPLTTPAVLCTRWSCTAQPLQEDKILPSISLTSSFICSLR